MTPTVTIGMPVRNGAAYLEEAISSLLAQTETDFILHISDNCSDDATPEICARFAAVDERIRYELQERNLGAAGNFEYLLRAARTPFFMWAAHDNLWDPTFLASSLQLLRQAPDAVACFVGVHVIDQTGTELHRILPSPGLASLRPLVRALAATAHGQWMAFYGLMRRGALPANSHVDDIYGTDIAFVFGMALVGNIVTTGELLFTYRLLDIAPKQGGGDAHLYDDTRVPNQMFRAMLRNVDRIPLRPDQKVGLRLLVLVRWLASARRIWASRNARGIRRAVVARRFVIGTLRWSLQVVLAPRQIVAGIRRYITAATHR